MNETPPACLDCGRSFHGRSDKKFCSDNCRNRYNNQRKQSANKYIREVNKSLLQNRRILENLLPAGKIRATTYSEKLAQQGFCFGFHTLVRTNKQGQTIYYCYEYGYCVRSDRRCLVLRDSQQIHN